MPPSNETIEWEKPNGGNYVQKGRQIALRKMHKVKNPGRVHIHLLDCIGRVEAREGEKTKERKKRPMAIT
jgi:hypothetical protein